MDLIIGAHSGAFFDYDPTGESAAVRNQDILFHNAKRADHHVAPEHGIAVNDGSWVNIQRAASKLFPVQCFNISTIQRLVSIMNASISTQRMASERVSTCIQITIQTNVWI
jgi:hypothetical protein